ncbi:hypothetical protein A8O14_02700 [Polynucleobacter wuianus]|uniref:HNH endonuclease 5 domain-containing protein n=1 Tax=Polynucleobacter wuianus TaxID=1743168 RepID=A0A191UDY6_9BURK|nr:MULTISPECIES: hypothetical protein [Polynucleobacter]ANI99096.1 hypothetical protein A8O14_02700 [Polynucleobacter wuianus]MBU3552331.1 HNH endonuclease [Polynucleobacter sp. MWH-Post4-6-1]
MSKAYKNKACVYCLKRQSIDGDHVIARQFFLAEQRDKLPKVPACKDCNNEKSQLEHYLTTVLPFGGTHASSSTMLSTLVPNRLKRNLKLYNALIAGAVINPNRGRQKSSTIPFDGSSLTRLYELIARGLAWHHWRLLINEDYVVRAGFFINEGVPFFQRLLAMNATNRVFGNFGNGVFQYEGVQAIECPQLTVWRMSFYGVEVGGHSQGPQYRSSQAFCISASIHSTIIRDLPHLFWGQQ